MGLKLFADHCMPFSIVQSLREAGMEVLVLKDHIPPDSPDLVVISKADQLDAVLNLPEWGFCRYRELPAGKVPRNNISSNQESSRGDTAFNLQTTRLFLSPS